VFPIAVCAARERLEYRRHFTTLRCNSGPELTDYPGNTIEGYKFRNFLLVIFLAIDR
jgi:hypothetical protein